MLKLVFQTTAFGPINLEYEKPVVRVGSSEDNDLVLLHPSIKPRHCVLTFWDENLALLPPETNPAAGPMVPAESSAELHGVGDQLRIGDLTFTLGHSANTVALPQAVTSGAPAGLEADESDAPPGTSRYYCAQCGRFIPEAHVRRIGLVGRQEHFWCPRCSSPVVKEEVEEKVSWFIARLRRFWQFLKKVYTTPPPRRPGSHGRGRGSGSRRGDH